MGIQLYMQIRVSCIAVAEQTKVMASQDEAAAPPFDIDEFIRSEVSKINAHKRQETLRNQRERMRILRGKRKVAQAEAAKPNLLPAVQQPAQPMISISVPLCQSPLAIPSKYVSSQVDLQPLSHTPQSPQSLLGTSTQPPYVPTSSGPATPQPDDHAI